jgi:ribose transport system substrate-binding protein
MKYVRSWLVALAALALVLAGCSGTKQSSGPSGQAGKKAARQFVIGMSQCNLGEPWRVQMNADIKAAADKHPDIKMIYKDAQNKTTVQQDQVKEFVNLGVDLIIISPKEALPLTKPVADAMDAGIPVIVLDRKVEGDKYTCFIGGDNRKIGEEAGKFMAKLLGGKGSIVELKGLMTSTPAVERHEGFMKGIKGSQIKIVFDADCHWLEPDAQKEMASALSRFPDGEKVEKNIILGTRVFTKENVDKGGQAL